MKNDNIEKLNKKCPLCWKPVYTEYEVGEDNIFITLENNEISTTSFFVMPDGKTYPPSQLPDDQRLLKGFVWREDERPVDKDAIFIRDSNKQKTENKFQPSTLKN